MAQARTATLTSIAEPALTAIIAAMSGETPSSGDRWHRRLFGHEFFAPAQWRRRTALWTGGVIVGVAAIVFARSSDFAFEQFRRIVAISPWLPLAVTPVVFAFLAALTKGLLKPTRGSGIPQVMAAVEVDDPGFRQRVLSPPVTFGKMLLTLVGLAGGASIGRKGPTIHVGAGLMYWIGRKFGYTDPKALSRFILAGGGAGIAEAFNAPLAGVVFAIEELAGTYEHRFSGIILTAVIFAGVVSLGVLGDYAYFGLVTAQLPLSQAAFAVLLCGVCGGIGGGLFARAILLPQRGPLARIADWQRRSPVVFATVCGLTLAGLGVLSGSAIYGTGYAEAHGLIQATHEKAAAFGLLKLAANILSCWAAIPGGIFSPALTVGAGMGNTIAAVISLELTSDHSVIIPIMAVCLLARGISSLVCRVPVYRAFAARLLDQFERERNTAAAPVEAGPAR